MWCDQNSGKDTVPRSCYYSSKLPPQVWGYLVFWIGLTITGPAWSTPVVTTFSLQKKAQIESKFVSAVPPAIESVSDLSGSVTLPDLGMVPEPAVDSSHFSKSVSLSESAQVQSENHQLPQPIAGRLESNRSARQLGQPIASPLKLDGADSMSRSPMQLSATPTDAPPGNNPPPPDPQTESPKLKQKSPPTLEQRPVELPPTNEETLPLPSSTPESGTDPEALPSPQPSLKAPQPDSNPAQPASSGDSELGILRLRELTVQTPPSPPSVFLLGGVDYYNMDNIFFSNVDPVDDSLFRYGLTLLIAPPIGPQTYLVAAIDGNLFRYANQSDFNYNELRFRAEIFQQLTPRMVGELGWMNQQLYATRGSNNLLGDRFLNDHAVFFSLRRRDPLVAKLNLDTFYQFRASFADPADRSRIINTFNASLGYDIQPQLQAAIDYQLGLVDFTQQNRDDQYHQLLARLSYRLTQASRLSLFGGFSFGSSSDPNINFNGSMLGVSLDVNLPLF